MPVKLVFFIIILIVVSAFIGFNIGFTSDVSFWPSEKGTLSDVPILVSFFVMYMLGVISVIPFFVGFWYRKGKKTKKKATDADKESKTVKAKSKKTRFLGAKASRDESEAVSEQKGEVE